MARTRENFLSGIEQEGTELVDAPVGRHAENNLARKKQSCRKDSGAQHIVV